MLEDDSEVDLRSDTVTKPTQAMLEAIVAAPLGDDGLDRDPTVRLLEKETALLLHKESALFLPSATMANLIAILVQAPRQTQILMEEFSHIYTNERGASALAGVFPVPIPGRHGAMDTDYLEYILENSSAALPTSIVCMETSHNNAGGTVLSLEHMAQVCDLSARYGIPIHLDGARIFNAAIALDRPVAELCSCADTVTVCLSKGLSAPGGALLTGSEALVAKSLAIRKMLGGTQRQAGVMAAAGLVGLRTMISRLADDHLRAKKFSEALTSFHPGLAISKPDTNIVMVNVEAFGSPALTWTSKLKELGVLVRPWGPNKLRCVMHRHINDVALDKTILAFTKTAEVMSSPS